MVSNGRPFLLFHQCCCCFSLSRAASCLPAYKAERPRRFACLAAQSIVGTHLLLSSSCLASPAAFAPPPTTILCAWAQPEPPARTQEPCNAKPKTSQRSRRSPSPERRPVLENRAADRRAPSPSSARFAGPESSRSNPVPPRVPRRRAASVPLLSHSPERCPLRILCCRPSIRLPPLGKIPAAAASPHRR